MRDGWTWELPPPRGPAGQPFHGGGRRGEGGKGGEQEQGEVDPPRTPTGRGQEDRPQRDRRDDRSGPITQDIRELEAFFKEWQLPKTDVTDAGYNYYGPGVYVQIIKVRATQMNHEFCQRIGDYHLFTAFPFQVWKAK